MSSGNDTVGSAATTTVTGDWRPATGRPFTHDLFVVGRIRGGERRLMFPRATATPPFPGPWELRAVFGG